jgi:ABC-2 type transport system ATP-binding protein
MRSRPARRLARSLAGACLVLALLAVPAQARDAFVTSFDGTRIAVHVFPRPGLAPGQTAPTVLVGPGWGGTGATDVAAAPIAPLHAAGYNVLTWDPRGFGASTGTVTVNSPDFEGRDMQAILDYLAAQPEAQLDGPGDPRVGMSGGSYGGAIQLVAAGLDRRVDAIAPEIAWHSLVDSLAKTGIVKIGWSGLLYGVAATRPLDPHVPAAYQQALRTGTMTSEQRAWYAGRGASERLLRQIKAPTLLVQGTADGLFTLEEAIANRAILRAAGVPTAMLWYCGGHGVCLTHPGDPERRTRAVIAWLDRYVKGDAAVDTGPDFETVDQDGRRWVADGYPVPAGRAFTAAGAGRLRLRAAGGSGPVDATNPILAITPARARNAVNVRVRAGDRRALVIGAPRVRLTYRGRAGTGSRPTRIFAQLVDDKTRKVLGNQVTPIALRLDGRRHTASAELEVVAHRVRPGTSVTLQLVATTTAYARPRLGGSVRFESIRLRLPVGRVRAGR